MKKSTLGIHQQQTKAASMHTSFRHYTTIDSLSHIFSSNTFRLSCLDRVNDPIEEQRAEEFNGKTYFVTCFSHSKKESIPLWRMYGGDSNGICIEFSNIDFFNNMSLYRGIPDKWKLGIAQIIDVYYSDRHECLYDSYDVDGERVKFAGCVGFVKTKAWSYEEETRVRCQLHRFNIEGNKTISDWNDFVDIFNPKTPYLYVHVPDEFLLSARIYFNPFMSEPMKQMVIGGLLRLKPSFPTSNFINSALEGRIRLR